MGNYDSVLETKPEQSSLKEIEIIFESKNNVISVGTAVGEYHSHPAFQAFSSNGLWIGKFETSYLNNSLNIKPNVISLRNKNASEFFELAYNYKENSNSHMMKSTEWGAASYLSLSKYGINKEVNINNNTDFLTGYSSTSIADQSNYPGTQGNDPSITLPYNTETGYLASITGNISGIYDMSGGSHEYMAAYVDGFHTQGGFSNNPVSTYGSKYFDIYPSNGTHTNFNNRILGDATGELGPFYIKFNNDGYSRNNNNWWPDVAHFISDDFPWMRRGGDCYDGVLAGQLLFGRHSGYSDNNVSFRVVLAN